MFGYLVMSLLLLVVMAWFVLSPFLVPAGAVRTSSRPPVVTPPSSVAARAATTAQPAAAKPAAAATTAATATSKSAAQTRTEEELRASVEAAIAARKAAMVRHSCGGCGAPVDAGDAFCRACGTRVEEG